jgi:hypothetical protein
MGVVGDGGKAAFEAELVARTPAEGRSRLQELEEREMAGRGTDADFLESTEIFWPAYFADPENVPPLPRMKASSEVFSGHRSEMSVAWSRSQSSCPRVKFFTPCWPVPGARFRGVRRPGRQPTFRPARR